MKTITLWVLILLLLIGIGLLIKSYGIYERFDSRPQVLYIWKSGDSISGRFSPYWNELKQRIKNNKLNIKMCDVDVVVEPDLARYEQSNKTYKEVPFVRLISSKGNRYDYDIANDYRYYYGGRMSDIGGYLASNKIYKMIVDKKNA